MNYCYWTPALLNINCFFFFFICDPYMIPIMFPPASWFFMVLSYHEMSIYSWLYRLQILNAGMAVFLMISSLVSFDSSKISLFLGWISGQDKFSYSSMEFFQTGLTKTEAVLRNLRFFLFLRELFSYSKGTYYYFTSTGRLGWRVCNAKVSYQTSRYQISIVRR